MAKPVVDWALFCRSVTEGARGELTLAGVVTVITTIQPLTPLNLVLAIRAEAQTQPLLLVKMTMPGGLTKEIGPEAVPINAFSGRNIYMPIVVPSMEVGPVYAEIFLDGGERAFLTIVQIVRESESAATPQAPIKPH